MTIERSIIIKGSHNSVSIHAGGKPEEREPVYAETALERGIAVADLLAAHYRAHENDINKAPIRLYGLFSNLGNAPQTATKMAELVHLEEAERTWVRKMLKAGFPIRQIISLDYDFSLNRKKYQWKRIHEREESLLEEVDRWTERDNYEIVVDRKHTLGSIIMLGDDILFDAMQISGTKYTKTLITSDLARIEAKKAAFDALFQTRKAANEEIRMHYRYETERELIASTIKERSGRVS